MNFAVNNDPESLGLSQERLARIPTFFNKAYLQTNRLACMATLVARDGEIAHLSAEGVQDTQSGTAIGLDTIYRIYSMTKPITAVAAMMCFEEGLLRLEHPVSRYIPSFKTLKVWAGGTVEKPDLADPVREMTVLDLFCHTSGLTYDFLGQHPVEGMYVKQQVIRKNHSLATMCEMLAEIPLVASPGERWNYSVSMDVLGHIVELVSGLSLDVFLQTRILAPLGMVDTGFTVPTNKLDRFASCYSRDPVSGETTRSDAGDATSPWCREGKKPQVMFSGGGGLVSTLSDYFRFCLMLRNGGELDGVRLLSPKTINYMMRNHLPGNKTMSEMGDSLFSESNMDGNGFGLGGAVLVDDIAMRQPSSPGTFSWGGLASTYFWIDPVEDLIAIQMTQLIPSRSYPTRPQFQQLIYASLLD